MRSSDKGRGALGRWAIISVMVLLLASFVIVSPMSGAARPKSCPDTCSKTKYWYEPEVEGKDFPICLVKLYDPDLGYKVWYKKWAYKERTCNIGEYYKDCQDKEYCSQTGACAVVDTYEKYVGPYYRCGGWKTQYYWLEER